MSPRTIREVAETMAELFSGREGSSAIKMIKDGKKLFIPYRDPSGKDIPLSVDTCLKHLGGSISLGSYPIDQSDQVRWAAVDFDGKRGDPLKDAVEVKHNLEKAYGLICWLERSQSGNGIHLWMFFDKKYSAAKIRKAISSCIPEWEVRDINARKTSFDRVFPHQDVAGGGYGNLCALPLNGAELVKTGKTAFIDEQGNSLEDQSETIFKIKESLNRTAIFDAIKEIATARPTKKGLPVLQQIPGGTKLLAPQGCAWLRNAQKKAGQLGEPEWYAALCQFAKVEQGEVLAHKFSEPYPDYDYSATQKKFEHALKENKPMTCETVWANFGDCGKRCGHLGVKSPWELAKVPLGKLDEGNKGRIYNSKNMADTALALTKEIAEGKRMGVAWGYDLLDDHTELRPQNLIVVAARQGMGKTAVMIDASVRQAERGIPQYIFSIEMGYEQLSMRYLARISGVDHAVITTGKVGKADFDLIEKAYEKFVKLPIYVDDSTRNLDRMLDNAGDLVYKNGKGVIWIDYLQLVRKNPNESKKEAVDRAVDSYKQMSKILEVPVVTLAQLNRSEEFAEGDDDLDSWLKDSGDIEQTADVIHYLRGPRQSGIVDRRWRLHKERHRASGINFRFIFHQGIFKLDSEGYWNKRAVLDEDSDEEPQGGFGTIV